MPYATLRQAGYQPRRGQFGLIAAAPGVGKTVWATNWAYRAGVPTLYFSADSDEYTVSTRMIALITGHALFDVERHLANSEDHIYDGALKAADHIDWCFESHITPDEITPRVHAYEELHGKPPELIVVDNLKNTVDDPMNEYAELGGVSLALQNLARMSHAHVLALHHTKGEYENGDKPIPLGGLLGNLSKIPEQVVTLYRAGPQELGFVIAKNRGGRSGSLGVLPVDYEGARVNGYDR